MIDAAMEGTFKGLYIQGEDIAQSDPNTQHITAGLVRDGVRCSSGFVPERDGDSYAHVFLPGSSFLEKDGTFTNAERRISRVRKAIPPMAGMGDWEITQALSKRLGYPMNYTHPSEIMDEIARLTPSFAGVSFDRIDELGSVQWPCNDKAPEGTPVMHIGRVRARQGQVHDHGIHADRRAHHGPLPLNPDHRPDPDAIQRGRADCAAPRTTSGIPKTSWKFIRWTRRIAALTRAIWSRWQVARAIRR